MNNIFCPFIPGGACSISCLKLLPARILSFNIFDSFSLIDYTARRYNLGKENYFNGLWLARWCKTIDSMGILLESSRLFRFLRCDVSNRKPSRRYYQSAYRTALLMLQIPGCTVEGVDGAIHRAAGQFLRRLRRICAGAWTVTYWPGHAYWRRHIPVKVLFMPWDRSIGNIFWWIRPIVAGLLPECVGAGRVAAIWVHCISKYKLPAFTGFQKTARLRSFGSGLHACAPLKTGLCSTGYPGMFWWC